MMPIRYVQRWSSMLVSSARVLSTSAISFEKNGAPVDVGQPKVPHQPLPLDEGLLEQGVDKLDQSQLKKYLKERKLGCLAKEAEEKGYSGPRFIANIHDLAQHCPEDVESLSALVNSQLAEQQNKVEPDMDFCGNGAVVKGGRYYYLERFPKTILLSTLRKTPGFYLIHGPRRSGKSTLTLQMINELDDSFVFGMIELLDDIPVSDFWTTLAKRLSAEDSKASLEVREAAKKYLDPSTQADPNFLLHLFRQNYRGKKLILFWDEFDRAHDIKYRAAVALALRSLSNAVVNSQGSFSNFGGVVCLGAFNATLVNEKGISAFTPDMRYTHKTLDFSLDETKELFMKYQERTKKIVSSEVVESIQQQTGGHAGLVNVCGRFIKHDLGGSCDIARWQNAQERLVSYLGYQNVYRVLVNSFNEDKELMVLLNCLCQNKEIIDPNNPVSEAAQHHGLAKMEKRDENYYLSIKSELIRSFVRRFILHERPAFKEVPMKDGLVDIPSLVSAVVRTFDVIRVKEDGEVRWREIEGLGQKKKKEKKSRAQAEVVYADQFAESIRQSLLDLPRWSFQTETEVEERDERMDLILICKGPDGKDGLRVGIEFTASLTNDNNKEHAARDYPKIFDLDQYVVVHFTPHEQYKTPRICWHLGVDKAGNAAQIQILHVIHNSDFTKVDLMYQPSPDASGVREKLLS